MLAVWKREFQNYFLTPIGYVFMTVFLLAGGVFFFLDNVLSQTNSLSTMFSDLIYVFMIIVPILTMRLLAEEKRSRTDQLLLTSPLSITSIVLGKFLAAVSVFFLSIVGTGFNLIVIISYGRVYWGIILTSYLGYFFLGCVYIAIGVLMSSLTENQVSAAVLTFGVILALQIIESIAPNLTLPDKLSFLTTMGSWCSMYSRFYSFTAGMLSLANIIYFLSVMGVMLFLTIRVIDKRRWSEG